MRPVILLLMAVGVFAGCGEELDEGEDTGQPAVEIRIVERSQAANTYAPAAATAPAAFPTTLIFALVGPGGTRTETVDFAAHQISLPRLRRGIWSIRGDGLDANGSLGWSAKPVVFSVAAGKRVPITLEFVPTE